MMHKTLVQLAKILDNKTGYEIFVARNLNNELIEIIIKPIKVKQYGNRGRSQEKYFRYYISCFA